MPWCPENLFYKSNFSVLFNRIFPLSGLSFFFTPYLRISNQLFQFVRLQVGFGLPDLTIQSLEILTLVIGGEEEVNLKFVCVEVEIFLHFLNQMVSSSLSPTNHQRLSGAVFKYLQMRTGSLKENFLLCGLLVFFKGFFLISLFRYKILWILKILL